MTHTSPNIVRLKQRLFEPVSSWVRGKAAASAAWQWQRTEQSLNTCVSRDPCTVTGLGAPTCESLCPHPLFSLQPHCLLSSQVHRVDALSGLGLHSSCSLARPEKHWSHLPRALSGSNLRQVGASCDLPFGRLWFPLEHLPGAG